VLRLRAAKSDLSPERALASLRRIHRHRFTLNSQPLNGVGTITREQWEILHALRLTKPSIPEQLTLL